MNWKHVDDELPKSIEDVLCCEINVYFVGWYQPKSGRWYADSDWSESVLPKYWCEIEEPTKQTEKHNETIR